MSDFENLEKELARIKPKPPSVHFTSRVEEALGDSGTMTVRRLDDRKTGFIRNRSIVSLLSLTSFGLGMAALLVFSFWFAESNLVDAENAVGIPSAEITYTIDEDSPIHGVSLDQLESLSGMPVNGWLDPQKNERLLKKVDEGLVDRPNGDPVRQVRYHFLDETLWRHPASDTNVISTTPRQEVYLIDLELY